MYGLAAVERTRGRSPLLRALSHIYIERCDGRINSMSSFNIAHFFPLLGDTLEIYDACLMEASAYASYLHARS